MTQTTTMLTLFLGSIAAISLVVGGIGIMNIMMVSVTERTREIGIRKALGATFQNIMMQFLIESVVIGVIGGLLGVACGVGIALAISESGLFETVITAAPIIISFSFSVGIGSSSASIRHEKLPNSIQSKPCAMNKRSTVPRNSAFYMQKFIRSASGAHRLRRLGRSTPK